MSRTMHKLALLTAALIGISTTSYGLERQRYVGEAEHFDFGIETEENLATLYIARKPTNEPFVGTPRLVPDDESIAPLAFEPTNDPGVYKVKYETPKLPEGQIEVEWEGVKEAADAYVVDAAAGHHDHDHSHGTPRLSLASVASSPPAIGAMALGLFLLGLAIGLKKRSSASKRGFFTKEASMADSISKVSAIIFCVLSGVYLIDGKAFAGEGHSHGSAEIGGQGAIGEVPIAKKSQFLIQLRTQPAKKASVKETLETFGHLSPNPHFDASLRAPANGFVRLVNENLLGSKIQKGQLLGRLDGIGAIDLVAPISGTVVELSAASGTRLEAGASILRIVNTNKLWVDAEVFQKDIAKISGVKEVHISLDSVATPISGRVLGIKSAIDERTLTAKVYIEVDNADGQLPLGAVANVSFTLAGESTGMVFPKGTVLNRGGEKIVFVQTGAESFVAKPVVTRFGTKPDTVVVIKGLEEGERVVVSGGYQILVGAN